jgi:hypothetical protein
MTARSLWLAVASAGFALLAGLSAPASAGPCSTLVLADETGLLHMVADNGNCRWRYRNGTAVRAPFTDVEDSALGLPRPSREYIAAGKEHG